ncbi:Sporulation kinase D [Anaerolineae bacterium]|nr:Sporulation kinase D [Anaerolineae bacterium]
MGTTPPNYPLNSRVTVSITQYIAAGLLGRLDDDTRAIIRNREIAWNAPGPLQQYVGQVRQAVVIGFNPTYAQLEISLRLVERNPWEEFAARFVLGNEVEGRVVGLIEGAAFVELAPGVEGYLPLLELPLDPPGRIEDWLWIDDTVKALVSEVDIDRRHLRLDLKTLLSQRAFRFQHQLWPTGQPTHSLGPTVAEVLPAATRLQLLRMVSDAESAFCEQRLEVLVIEDDPVYAAGLDTYLKSNGCQVTLVEDGIKGLACVANQDQRFELILLDWNLPSLKGHQLIGPLQERINSPRLVMLLEPAPLADQPEIWEDLWNSGVDVFAKADGEQLRLGLMTILKEIRAAGSHRENARQRFFPNNVTPAIYQASFLTANEDSSVVPTQRRTIPLVLTEVQRDTQASTVVLLRLEPGRPHPLTEVYVGRPLPLEQATPDLIHSPLKDILEKGQEVWEKNVDQLLKFGKLLELLSFKGFLGIPVLSASSTHYGLVLLKEQGDFSPPDRDLARSATYFIAGLLQEERLIQILRPWQSQNLIGQLLNNVIHEITNKLGGLEHQIESIQKGIRELASWPEKAQDVTFVQRLEQNVERMVDAHKQAQELRDRYLGLTTGDEPRLVELKTLAEEIIRVLRPEAQRHNIFLALRAADNVPSVWGRPSQFRQILLNIMLNALQQMAGAKRRGHIIVEISFLPQAPLPIQTRVIDEGFGIHRRLWEHIFDFGFTTKKDGAGLGLTVSRQVTASLGGSLCVEASHIFWGTTFLLQFPKGAKHG